VDEVLVIWRRDNPLDAAETELEVWQDPSCPALRNEEIFLDTAAEVENASQKQRYCLLLLQEAAVKSKMDDARLLNRREENLVRPEGAVNLIVRDRRLSRCISPN
jgi:hypothetical protein